MLKLVAFHGPAGSGKDACGAHLIQTHGYAKLSFAAPIYDMLEVAGFGRPTTQAQKEEVIPWLGVTWRHMAQTLGTEWGRNMVHPDLWRLIVNQRLEVGFAQGARFVITDLRFENEAELVRKVGGQVVHLRGRREAATTNQAHQSEQPLAFHPGDLSLHNDTQGLGALHEKLETLLGARLRG